MKFALPYSKQAVIDALNNYASRNSADHLDRLSDNINGIIKTEEKLKALENKKELNKAVADFNSIEIIELIDSPNYKALVSEYLIFLFTDLIATIKYNSNLSTKEAWGLIAIKFDLFDLDDYVKEK